MLTQRARAAWRSVEAASLHLYKMHRPRYWIGALAVLIVATLIAPYVEDQLGIVKLRYGLYQQMTQLEWRPLLPRFVKVVLIGDREHWGSELQGIVPIKREYLARLVDKLAADNATVIALDFDVRLTTRNARGTLAEIPSSTLDGVKKLVHSIIAAADAGHRIVLSKTIDFSDKGGYRLIPDIYQAFGICTTLSPDGSWQNPGSKPEFVISARAARNITCGYIALPYDMRVLPPPILLDTGQHLESFSLAVAKQRAPKLASKVSENAYYGSYIPPPTMEAYNVAIPSSDLLSPSTDTANLIYGNAVIVGAQWHGKAYGVGEIVDLHPTPIGPISGALIHENFAEAILDSRIFGYVPDWGLRLLEVLFGIVAAVAFALYADIWTKAAIFVGLCAVLVATQWLMLQIFGTFFEAFVPLMGLALHSVIERLAGQH